jgi:hypothetical protein
VKPLPIRLRGDDEFPHLPPGHRPGPQSVRARGRRDVVWPFVAVVGTAMYAAGVWMAAGGRGHRFDRQDEFLGGVLFGAIGLFCLAVALMKWQAGRPRRHPRLRGMKLSVAGDSLRRGGEVSVSVTGRPTPEDRIEVGLACDERYDTEVRTYARGVSVVIRQTEEELVHEQWQELAPAAAEQTFTFVVPVDAPYSYEGDCISYGWRVSARAVRPRQRDPRLDSPIWVEP